MSCNNMGEEGLKRKKKKKIPVNPKNEILEAHLLDLLI